MADLSEKEHLGRQRFNQEAKNWDTDAHRKVAKQMAENIQKIMQIHPEMKCMEFGCGTGLVSEVLAPHVKQIVGVDSAMEMITVLNDKQIPNVRGICMELNAPSQLSEKFDLIFSCMTFHHISKCQEMISVLATYLAPHGCLLIADLEKTHDTEHFHQKSMHGTVSHHGFDAASLANWFDVAGLKEVQVNRPFSIEKQTEQGTKENFGIIIVPRIE